jgi:hypothetical protein
VNEAWRITEGLLQEINAKSKSEGRNLFSSLAATRFRKIPTKWCVKTWRRSRQSFTRIVDWRNWRIAKKSIFCDLATPLENGADENSGFRMFQQRDRHWNADGHREAAELRRRCVLRHEPDRERKLPHAA